MQFMITHRHTPDNCMADDPAPVKKVANDADHAKECGVKVLSSHLAPPEHIFYFLVEADDYGKVIAFLRPLMTKGDHDIVPVQPASEALGQFS